MASDCNRWHAMMHEALDGLLDEHDREGFEEHLRGCKDCREKYEMLERSLELFVSISAPEPAPDFAASVMRQARKARAAHARSQHAAVIAAAAAMAIVVGVALVTAGLVAGPLVGGVLSGAWGVASNVWTAAAAVGDLLTSLAGPLASLVRVMDFLGGLALILAREGVILAAPIYLTVVAVLVSATLMGNLKRTAVRLPVLSI
ncbi:MAG: zf-HC2 domain-containing protein [Deltaproteobacteria bacterium]|nr:zf-HC2 domain-containing protein [Deltaproteobacteria bacterium]